MLLVLIQTEKSGDARVAALSKSNRLMREPMKPLLLAVLSLGFAFSGATHATNCARAKSPTEIAICSSPVLKAFDDYLAEAYADIRRIVPVDTFDKIKKSQLEWIKQRDAACGDGVDCLIRETHLRTAILNGFTQKYIEQLRLDLLGGESTASPPKADAKPLNANEVYTKAVQSVVVIVAYTKSKGSISQGSGVVIGSNLVATNCHVLSDAESAVVLFKGESHKIQSITGSPKADYCIARTTGLNAKVADTAGLSTVQPGNRVYSIGSPRGLELTIAEGLVSGLRDWDTVSMPMIQTTASISPGSSGGGLFDEYGRVIGITTSMWRDSQNLNFALPIELLKGEAQKPTR